MREFDVYKERKYLCCICGKSFLGCGNNPYPISETGECCGECNLHYVIPARLRMIEKKGDEK